MPWVVYMLRCRDGSLYTGITNDLSKRLSAHRAGSGSKYVRSRLPCELVWSQKLRSESKAKRREAAIKKMPKAGKEKLITRAA